MKIFYKIPCNTMYIVLIFGYFPIAGVTLAFRNYESATIVNVIEVSNINGNMASAVMLFIPIGYFLPVITNRRYKVLQLVGIFSIIGLMVGVCFSIALTGTVIFGLLLTGCIMGLSGGMAGYAVLIAINRLNISHKITSVKRVI